MAHRFSVLSSWAAIVSALALVHGGCASQGPIRHAKTPEEFYAVVCPVAGLRPDEVRMGGQSEWYPGLDSPRAWAAAARSAPSLFGTATFRDGVLLLTDTELVFLTWGPPPRSKVGGGYRSLWEVFKAPEVKEYFEALRVPYNELQSVAVASYGLNKWLVIYDSDGVPHGFNLLRNFAFIDSGAIERAYEFLMDHKW